MGVENEAKFFPLEPSFCPDGENCAAKKNLEFLAGKLQGARAGILGLVRGPTVLMLQNYLPCCLITKLVIFLPFWSSSQTLQSLLGKAKLCHFSLKEFSIFHWSLRCETYTEFLGQEGREMDICTGRAGYVPGNLKTFSYFLRPFHIPQTWFSQVRLPPFHVFSAPISTMSVIILCNQYGQMKEMSRYWGYQKKKL